MLSREKVLQTINEGKRKLSIEDVDFKVEYAQKAGQMGKRAEIVMRSEDHAEIVLYPTATLFSVRHELCHMKLYRMGIPLTNTKDDLQLFPNKDDYMRMVVIVEWYINELQKRVFQEYYAIDEAGTPRPQPFLGLPELPEETFTSEQIRRIVAIARRKGEGITS